MSEEAALVNMDIFGITGPYPEPGNTYTIDQNLRHLSGLFPFTDSVPFIPTSEFVLDSDYFVAPTDEIMTSSVSSELPDGLAWEAKYLIATVMYGLVFAWAGCFNVIRRLIQTIAREMNIYTTNELVSEWENSVGLPDSRLELSNPTLGTRQTNIVQRLAKNPTVTLQEFQQKIDDTLPNSGIWLTTGQNFAEFPYDFRYDFGSAYGVRERFVVFVNFPEFAEDQISWDNFLSWIKDFGLSGVLWVQNIIPKDQSYVVITHPSDYQTVYAEMDDAGLWQSIEIQWKQIDVLNTVAHVVDEELITPATTVVTRLFTDSSAVLIQGSTTPTVVTL